MTQTPQKFQKGDDVRLARTPRQAVELEFKGYAKVDTTRADLQALAKEAGIPANLSNAELEARLEKATGGDDEQPSALNQVEPHVEGEQS